MNSSFDLLILQNRWENLCARLGAQCKVLEMWEMIKLAYQEPHRHYHTLDHLEEIFKNFDYALSSMSSLKSKLYPEELNCVELAIFFHDIMYDTKAEDNEEISGEICQDTLEEMQCSKIDKYFYFCVNECILQSSHQKNPNCTLLPYHEEIFLDLDLSILGSVKFKTYCQKIRQEYAWVPDDIFNQQRSKILQQFLNRHSIYHNTYSQHLWEDRARKNLTKEITYLTDPNWEHHV